MSAGNSNSPFQAECDASHPWTRVLFPLWDACPTLSANEGLDVKSEGKYLIERELRRFQPVLRAQEVR